jgi:hypothetical protein
MSINFIKGELANAIELHDHLSSELDNSNVEAFTDEDWHSRLRSIGLETVKELNRIIKGAY